MKKKAENPAESGAELVLYQSQDGKAHLDVRIQGETAWLNQKQMAELFEKDVRTVNEHIQNVFSEGELEKDSVIRNFRITARDGKNYNTLHYNLDVVISIGYRVKSQRGTQFRMWATQRLKEYIVKGFTMDDERLKQGSSVAKRYYEELFERIREIRASERLFYQKVLDIYATSIDYDPKVESSQTFFATVQNKMHWAAHGQTAAEVIAQRVDSQKNNMGLTSFKGSRVQKTDTLIAKNYLSSQELDILNRLVSQYLEFAELQALSQKPMSMDAWIVKLDDFVRLNEREILTHAGKVSALEAEKLAAETYEIYKKERAKEDAERVDRDFEQAVKALPKEGEK